MTRSLLILAAIMLATCGSLLLVEAGGAGAVASARLRDVNAAASSRPSSAPAVDVPLLAALRPPDTYPGAAPFQILPVDPETLQPLAGYKPFEAGPIFTYAFSSDGRRLALLTQSPESMPGVADRDNSPAALAVIEMESWKRTVVQDEVAYGSSLVGFSVSGEQLYWIEPAGYSYPPEGGLLTGREYAIQVHAFHDRTTETVAQLPAAFGPSAAWLDQDRNQIAVLGGPVGEDSFSTDDTNLLLMDLANGQIAASISLEGTIAGSLFDDEAETDSWPVSIFRPEMAVDEASGRLYVTQTSGEAITVVDLAERSVREVIDLRPERSLVERLLGWLFPEAAAIARSITNGHILITDDGARLYTATVHERMTEDRQATEDLSATPLSIVDLRSGETVQIDLGGVQRMALSAGGRHLLVATFPHIFPVAAGDAAGQFRLYSLDPVTGETEAQVEVPGQPGHTQIEGPLLVGEEYAYVSYFGAAGLKWMVVDLATLKVVASPPAGGVTKLLVPPSA